MAQAVQAEGAPISELAVTYVAAGALDDSWVRCGKLPTPAYLWVRRENADPIRELKIIYDAEEAGAGWVKLNEDLNKNAKRSAFLCYSKAGQASPLIDVRIFADDEPVEDGFDQVEREVTRGGQDNQFHIYFKTQASKDRKKEGYQIGEFIDVLDTVSKWCVGRIVDINEAEKKYHVHFEGWSDKWNEWIPMKEPRFAKFRTHTRGKDTGPDVNNQAWKLVDPRNQEEFLASDKKVDELLEAKERTDADRQWLLTENLKMVQNILNSVVDDPKLLKRALEYLQKSLRVVIDFVNSPTDLPDAVVEAWLRIFDGDSRYKRFYNKYGMAKDSESERNGKFARRPLKDAVGKEVAVSTFLIENINVFGERGGFKAIADRLADNKRVTSFFSVRLIVRALAVALDNYQPDFLRAFVPTFYESVFARIRNVTDDELKLLDKDALPELIKNMELLMSNADMKTAPEFIEKFSLDLSLRLMTCKLLEKRINGVRELIDTIEKVRRKEDGDANMGGAHYRGRYEVTRFLNSKYMLNWIEENKVVEILLGPSSHHAIIRMSSPILKFLSVHEALKVEHVDLLWSSSIDKHETLIRTVYECMADLAQELSPLLLDRIYSQLAAVPLQDFTELLLQFLKVFTINAVRATHRTQDPPSRKWYGLDLFWRVLQDGVNVLDDVAELAHNTLAELLSMPEFEAQKVIYLDKCIINLRESRSVLQAIRVLKHIVDTFPPQGHNGRSAVEDVLNQLDQKVGLLGLLVRDFPAYNAMAQAARADDSKSEPNGKPEHKFKVGRYLHSRHLAVRLEVLDYVLTRSTLLLTQEHIETLWECFMTKAIFPSDRSTWLRWLNDARDENSHLRDYAAFNNDVASFIFTNLLCNPAKLDFSQLDPQGYRCFQTYFVFVNQHKTFLEGPTRQNPHRRIVVVSVAKLLGLQALWDIAALARNSEVAVAASKFLILVHTLLDSRLKKKDVFKQFIDTAMKALRTECEFVLNSGNSEESKTDHKKVITQVVALIELFLFRIEQKDEDDGMRDVAGGYVSPMKLEVLVRDKNSEGAGSTITVTISPDNKIGLMRKELAKHIQHPAEQLQFVYKNRVLYPEEYDKMSIYDARIRGRREQIVVYKMDKDDQMSRPDDSKSDHVYPRLLLANEKAYFDLLFQLLKIGGDVGQEVWKLLTRLPVNTELEKHVAALDVVNSEGKTDWNDLLDPSAILRLFYTLRIIDSTLTGKEKDTEQEAQARQAWCESFLAKGGLQHLYRILMGLKQAEVFHDVLPQQCVLVLVRLLNVFLAGKFAEQSNKLTADFVDGKALALHLLTLSEGVVTHPAEGPENADIQSGLLLQSIMLFIHTLSSRANLLSAVYESGSLLRLIQAGLLENPVPKVRDSLCKGLHTFCMRFEANADVAAAQKPRAVVLPMLLALLSKVDTRSTSANEFFHVTVLLLRASKPSENIYDAVTLSSSLAERIRQHPIIEARATDSDGVLRGLLNLTFELVQQSPQAKTQLGAKDQLNMVEDLFHNCLFAVPTNRVRGVIPPPKCKSVESRRAAFHLLGELAKGDDDNFRTLLKLLIPNHMISHSNGLNPREFEFEAKAEEKSDTGYVGLKNLGCICYMNSLLQQMFMVPKLRANLLRIEDKEEDKNNSFIHQLQYIVAFLQESEKMYCNPKQFCFSFKDWDNNPTNVHVQMDTQEFLNMLFDRIDTKVKGTPSENALKEVLGGVCSNELICKGCPHYKEREEEFYAVSLNVLNKKTLYESLDSFVAGEMLEGDNAYMCGQCNKKVDTLKRTCLKRLPPTVIFHLKRFEFDYESMKKKKLNSRLEFPNHLNLRPYTKEGLAEKDPEAMKRKNMDAPADGKDEGKDKPEETRPEEYYEYELTGVLVHTGSADRGHYYSFIKERLSKEDLDNGVEPRWFEFNDIQVRPFDPKDISEECFGGEELPRSARMWQEGMARQGMQGRGNVVQPQEMMAKFRNAYLIFYDRVPAGRKKQEPAKEVEVKEAAPVDEEKKQEQLPPASGKPQLIRQRSDTRVTIPPKILNEIWEQNVTYWRDKAIFDEDYFDFIWEIVQSVKPAPAEPAKELVLPAKDDLGHQVVELATRFVMETLSRSALKKPRMKNWMAMLKRLYTNNLPSCTWLLHTVAAESGWVHDFFLECTNTDVRKYMADLLCYALDTVTPLELARIPAYDELQKTLPESKDKDDEGLRKDLNAPLALRVTDRLISLIRYLPEHWKRFDMYFRLLNHIANLSYRHAHFMLHRNLVARLLDLYLGDRSPHPEVGNIPTDAKGKRRFMGDDYNTPDWTSFTLLLRTLVCSASTATSAKSRPSTTMQGLPDKDLPVLPQAAVEMLTSEGFLNRLLSEATTRKRGQGVSGVICHWCWENKELSMNVAGLITARIDEAGHDTIRPYFRVLMAFVLLEDSIKDYRVHVCMSSLLVVMHENSRYWKVTMLCLEHLIRIAKRSKQVYTWLNANGDKLAWILDYLEMYPRPPGYGQNQQVELYKPRQQNQYLDRGYVPSEGLSARAKKMAFEAIKEGKPLDQAGATDSDIDLADRVFQVGQWIDCQDTVSKWLPARVVEVDGDNIKVHYDGWPSKWDEWVERSSARLALWGTKQRDEPKDQQKGKGPQIGDNLGNGRIFNGEDDYDAQSREMGIA